MHLQPVRSCAYMPGSIRPIDTELSCVYMGLSSLYTGVSSIYAEGLPYMRVLSLYKGVFMPNVRYKRRCC